jgi:hypothetical protein
VSYGGWEV